MDYQVDVLILSADRGPLRREVLEGLARQHQVHCVVHRVIGSRRDSDANRYETIARARNQAKLLGGAPWAMFLDDDVELGADCILHLVTALESRPDWAAMAADYLGQSAGREQVNHVAMGATLFRRSALQGIQFRWEKGKCECRCCCDDLARQGLRVGYLPAATARHLPRERAKSNWPRSSDSQASPPREPQVLAALDSNHLELFIHQFMRTWRATGNSSSVTVVGYGLDRREQSILRRHPQIADLAWFPSSRLSPSVRRVCEFQKVLSRWPAGTPVAWWDAGDVLFQRPVDALWPLVRSHPDRILAVREPADYPRNPALALWLDRVPDHQHRLQIYQRLENRPFLNGGFVAGSADSLLRYLSFAERFLKSTQTLWDSWSDQLPLNYYCHTYPERWRQIDECWNYCLAYRGPRIVQGIGPEDRDWHPDLMDLPRVVTPAGRCVNVVHGNGNTLYGLLHSWRSIVTFPGTV